MGGWCGYATATHDYNKVSGSWIVPDASASNFSFCFFWIGLSYPGFVAQCGTVVYCADNSTAPSQFMWSEMAPQEGAVYSYSVTPGDHILSTITYKGSNLFRMQVTNTTTGDALDRSVYKTGGLVGHNGDQVWIAESGAGYSASPTNQYHVSTFEPVTFDGVRAPVGDPIYAYGSVNETMRPSAVTDGKFTVYWEAED